MSQERNIRLYMLLRLVLLFSVLLSLVLYQASGFLGADTIIKTYFVTFFTFLVTTGFIFLYEKAANVSYFLGSQVVYDILFTTVLIFYTGPFESMYTVFYLFNIMFAAIMFQRTGAIFAAILSAALYGIVAWVNSDRVSDEKSFSMLTTITGFVTLSLLASQLVEELRKSRQRISRLEELSEDIVNSLDSGLLGLDARGAIRKVNRTALQLLALDNVATVVGKTLSEAIPAVGGSERTGVKEVSVQGRMKRILVTRVDLPESHSMVLLKDLTEVLDLEEKVRRQERLAGVGRLATGVAHEIRNPIASISGAAQILNGPAVEDDEKLRLTQLIVRESERVDRLVNQLLKFAKPSTVQRDQVDVTQVLLECVESIKARPDFKSLGVEFAVDVEKGLPVRGNRDELSEVVTNLLVNAMQAFLEKQTGDTRRLSIEGKKRDSQVHIVVTDNGPGIPSEFRSRIFDPFFTTKSTGTGLGLAQVHKIVRDHDGQVDLESELGKGTSLTIRLPC